VQYARIISVIEINDQGKCYYYKVELNKDIAKDEIKNQGRFDDFSDFSICEENNNQD
jgi:hypothetical protein